LPGEKPTAASVGVFVVARDARWRALGCGALRSIDGGTVQIKRMFVRDDARGSGLGRRLLPALEEHAVRLGATRVVLETGLAQPDAVALYERAGYRRIPCFGAYAVATRSRCHERVLGSR
jgi:putative acetyltransferase